MFRIFCFLLMVLMLGCGDEGLILDRQSTHANAPNSPIVEAVIPTTAITHVEGTYASPMLSYTLHATYNGNDYVHTRSIYLGVSGNWVQLQDGQEPTAKTYSFEVLADKNQLEITLYYPHASVVHTSISNNFQFVGESTNPVDPIEDPVDPIEDPVDPVENPVTPPPTPPPTPIEPPLSPPRGEYVVWLEEVNGNCQSGVIHGDYVFIDYENKTITFTGQDGEVDPGDTVREYIKVETGLTYEAASVRAPEILAECR